MSKSLYSLMLNDDLVRELDMLAHRLGTNRSNLVNRICAEYLDYTTPESRINDVLSALDALMQPSRELVPFFAPHSGSMSLKSSLDYRYRPTIRYELSLSAGGRGELAVVFRTTSGALLQQMELFFGLWKQLEDKYRAALGLSPRSFALSEGRFTVGLSLPDKAVSADELANAISAYISIFDSLLKDFIAGRAGVHEIEERYYSYLKNSSVLI